MKSTEPKTLTDAIRFALGRRPDIVLWRANVVAAQTESSFVRAGLPGQGDVSGIISPLGRRLEIEVKEGKRDDLRDEQQMFGRMILRMGGVHMIACDEDSYPRLLRKWGNEFTVVLGAEGALEALPR